MSSWLANHSPFGMLCAVSCYSYYCSSCVAFFVKQIQLIIKVGQWELFLISLTFNVLVLYLYYRDNAFTYLLLENILRVENLEED